MIEGFDLARWVSTGSPPMYAIFLALIWGFWRYGPVWQKQALDAAANKRAGYTGRITELEQQLRTLREDCDRETKELKNEIKGLHAEIMGLRAQRVQEQIGIVSGILATVESPELQKQLQMLESVQRSMQPFPVLQTRNGNVIPKEDEQDE